MKAKTLKQLIAQIPDEEEVYYSYANDGDIFDNDDFDIQEFFDRGKKKILLAGGKPDGWKTKKEIEEENNWQNTISSFPKKPNWSISKDSWRVSKANVLFKVGGFEYPFGLDPGLKKLMRGWVDGEMKEFDSWEEFFAAAEPVVIKAAQKQREELEGLLET